MKFTNSTWRKISLFWHKLKLQTNRLNQLAIYQEARTRILMWYLFLMFLFTLIAIPVIRYRLIADVNSRVEADLREDLEKFEEELVQSLLESKVKPELEQTESEIANDNIYRAFNKFITSNEVADDNYFIAIVDGLFYKTNAAFLPTEIDQDSALMQHWQEITVEEEAEIKVDDPKIGSVIYKAEPIKTTEEVIGVFVVAHLSAGEQKEVLSSFNIVIQVLVLMILVASLLAWLAAGRVLAPLRNLSETVKSISESDLSQRINTQGQGEVAQLGRTFNAMMERLETAFDTQRNFINDAGHELKTPITIIRGHLELMDADPQSQQETVELVIDELDRMNRLVEDLVLLAKSERPDFLQIETIELTSFVTELFSKLGKLGQRNWNLDNAIVSGKMTGDRQRITQAIINLANNAVQHTVIDSLIVFGAKIENNHVEFWIRDTGDGIAVEEQKRIFDRFARIKNARRRSEGSGLGLAIVQTVVEAHGGAINLQSQLGIGSTFSLVFPLKFNEKQN
ncbi:two-component sensor histidine kinase [Pleurocapsa sp. CCALA 161]|uniref:sensor histidine kinase n=1 Tax=Pleurocapsa sp. CCALA 161 TaxID=2107688 RepID=UPI000D061CB3|nr:ATP-binding protein [Pleurocapsa sp. CCALA 161]PSB06790.1 two-component sensor histidine kinase [Pleurocapsa sp. CCALA 161]